MQPGVLTKVKQEHLKDVQKIHAKRRLSKFIRLAWQNIDPAEYVHNWHIDVICEHLEAVQRGEIKRLIINVPRRHTKSLALNVFFPAWCWLRNPKTSFMFSAYGRSLTNRDASKCRNLIQGAWYQDNWGNSVNLRQDQRQKTRFENTEGGYRLATSVGSGTLGEGADIICIDDPHSTKSTYLSDAERLSALEYYDTTLAHCLNNPVSGAIICIMQRLHVADMTGHLLSFKGENWEHLKIPMRFEKKHFETGLIPWRDPRKDEGQLLFPERFPESDIAIKEERLGSYGTAGQMQQRPIAQGGNLIQINWFKERYKEPYRNQDYEQIVQSWDTAQKVNELNDYSVCTTWGLLENKVHLLHVLRKKMMAPELLRRAVSMAAEWRPNAILIEDKASGIGLIQHMEIETSEPVKPILPVAGKEIRMMNETPAMEAGKVILPEDAYWLNDFEVELFGFPACEHDDQIDSVSQFLAWFRVGRERIFMA